MSIGQHTVFGYAQTDPDFFRNKLVLKLIGSHNKVLVLPIYF